MAISRTCIVSFLDYTHMYVWTCAVRGYADTQAMQTDAITMLHSDCYFHAAVLLTELKITQIVKKLPALYRTRKKHSTPSHLTPLTYALILFSHLHLRLPCLLYALNGCLLGKHIQTNY
jgi:hypothetical protein